MARLLAFLLLISSPSWAARDDQLCRDNGAPGRDAALCSSPARFFSSTEDACDSYISRVTPTCIAAALRAYLDFMRAEDELAQDAAKGRFDAAFGEMGALFNLAENPATQNNAARKRIRKIKARTLPMLEAKRGEMLKMIGDRGSEIAPPRVIRPQPPAENLFDQTAVALEPEPEPEPPAPEKNDAGLRAAERMFLHEIKEDSARIDIPAGAVKRAPAAGQGPGAKSVARKAAVLAMKAARPPVLPPSAPSDIPRRQPIPDGPSQRKAVGTAGIISLLTLIALGFLGLIGGKKIARRIRRRS